MNDTAPLGGDLLDDGLDSLLVKVVREGRKPGLLLKDPDANEISLQEWGHQILTRMQPYAKALDEAQDLGSVHQQALAAQEKKILNASQCPSARLLDDIQSSGLSFTDFTLQQSERQQNSLIQEGLPPEVLKHYEALAEQSLQEREAIENQPQEESFEEYLGRFNAGL